MNSIKKCKHCGEWSEWNQGAEALCKNCGHLLDPEASKALHTRKNIETVSKKIIENSFFTIKPSDNAVMISIRKIAWLGYMVYLGIMGFFIWLAASIAG